MKKTNLLRKMLVFACAGALIACVSVAATIAYFTDSEVVVNTFTVGRVGISMDELDYDKDANTDDNVTIDGVVRDKANAYHLIPGKTYDKDPTIRVDADSEDCWIFVKVENQIAAIELAKDKETETEKQIATQMDGLGWTLVTDTTDIYAYKEIVSAGEEVKVFNNFTIDGETVDNDILKGYGDKTVNVTAYAIQAMGFKTSADAWAAYENQHQ